MSKKPKKFEGHPATKILFSFLGALTDFTGMARVVDSIRLRVQVNRIIRENEKQLMQFEEYAAWMQEYEQLMRRRPKVGISKPKPP